MLEAQHVHSPPQGEKNFKHVFSVSLSHVLKFHIRASFFWINILCAPLKMQVTQVRK